MNRAIRIVCLFAIFQSTALCSDVADKLIKLIDNSNKLICTKLELILNGNEVYTFKSDNGEIFRVISNTEGPKGNFKFIELRFGLEISSYKEYVTRETLKNAYPKLTIMIESIKIEDIKEKQIKDTLPSLIKKLQRK